MARLKVLVRRRLPQAVETRLSSLFEARLNPDDGAVERTALEKALQDCDVLVPSVAEPVDAGLIAAAGPRLRLIANFGVGVDNIDLNAARLRGIAVTNTPGVLTEDTAESRWR